MDIRSATPSDAPAIASIHVHTWQCAYRGQIPDSYLESLSVKTRTLNWEKTLTDPKNTTVWVAVEGDQLLGFCHVGPTRDLDASAKIGELYAIYVHPSHLNQGIGTQLHTRGLATLKQQGFKQATLWTLTSNDRVKKFYELKGWQNDGATKSEPRDGFTLDQVRYRITL